MTYDQWKTDSGYDERDPTELELVYDQLHKTQAALREMETRNETPEKERRYILSGGLCVTCSQHMASEMMPPHDASPRCESGKRNHCSCDVCF